MVSWDGIVSANCAGMNAVPNVLEELLKFNEINQKIAASGANSINWCSYTALRRVRNPCSLSVTFDT
jgi:hypothetical protein